MFTVLVDKVTGVTYMATMREGTRITPMLDKDGKPYVDPRFGSR